MGLRVLWAHKDTQEANHVLHVFVGPQGQSFHGAHMRDHRALRLEGKVDERFHVFTWWIQRPGHQTL